MDEPYDFVEGSTRATIPNPDAYELIVSEPIQVWRHKRRSPFVTTQSSYFPEKKILLQLDLNQLLGETPLSDDVNIWKEIISYLVPQSYRPWFGFMNGLWTYWDPPLIPRPRLQKHPRIEEKENLILN